MSKHSFSLSAAILSVGLFYASSAHGQVQQSALARQVLNGTPAERARAVETARSLGASNLNADLRSALITALEGEARVRAQRYHAGQRGEEVPPLEDPTLIARLSGVVAELRDPIAIPALIGALGTNSIVARTLAGFGEEVLPALVSAIKDTEGIEYVVEGSLMTLRFMLEGAAPQPLSASARRDIKNAVENRLTGEQLFTTLWEAMDVASVLGDPALNRILQSLASETDSVLARGIEDPGLIQETQELAAKRLAGTPPRPRWK